MALILFCLSAAANAQSAAELVERAKTSIENKEFDSAIDVLTKAITIDKKTGSHFS
jgi:hypothetical protein